MKNRIDLVGYLGVGFLVLSGLVRLVLLDSGPLSLGLLVVGVALFLVYFFKAERSVQGFLSRRSTREGGNVLGTSLFVIGIAVLVNLLAINFPTRIDITEDKLFTLAPETAAAIREAPAPIEFWVMYPDQSPVAAQLTFLLEAARDVSPDVSFQIVDPERNPLKAMEFGLREPATVVQIGPNFEAFTGPTEEKLLAAIIKASDTRTLYVGFLAGHGESQVVSSGPSGMRWLAETMGRRGMSPFSLNILRGGALSDSLDVVVIPGAESPLAPAEVDSLFTFLDRGGRMLVLLDPTLPNTLETLLSPLGVQFDPRILADPEQLDPQVIHPKELSAHPAMGTLVRNRVQVSLPGVGALEVTPKEGVRHAVLMRSGGQTTVAGDPESHVGSRGLGVALEWQSGATPKVSRLVVVGDVDFATNQHVQNLANADMFLGSIQWLSEQESRIGLSSRDRTSRPLILSRQQGRALTVLMVIVLPLAVLFSGSMVWWRRR